MVTFVILHYKTIDETLKCLSTIKDTLDGEYNTIVVDNHTLDDEQKEMIEQYTKDIIVLDDNLGFAKSNNIGAHYAISKYNPDFLAVINNDVYITQSNFIEIIYNDYQKYQFDMLGPWIESPGDSCNPFPVIYGKDNIISAIRKSKKLVKIYNNIMLYFLLEMYIKIKHLIKKPTRLSNAPDIKHNVPLHGCAIIFSKKYYDKYSDVFYDDTFLFHEEEFLYDRLIKDHLTSIYDPNLRVFHQEGTSVKKSSSSQRKSKLFKQQEKIKSLEKLLQQL